MKSFEMRYFHVGSWIMLVFTMVHFANTTSKLDTMASKSALLLCRKWLKVPNIYFKIVLPNKVAYNINDVIRLTKSIPLSIRGDSYISYVHNVTHTTYDRHQGEVIWSPYETENHDGECEKFYTPYTTSARNIFILKIKDDNYRMKYFENCKIRYDSNIVIYYRYKDTESSHSIRFEEIYKIKEENELQTNILGNFNLNSMELDTTPLSNFIWNRRSNLNHTLFSGIGEKSFPQVEDIICDKLVSGKIICNPTGYYLHIVHQLMRKLNFTVLYNLPEGRNNWTYLVDQIHKKNFDFSFAYFTHSSHRSKLVDFSYGITPLIKALFYVKETKASSMDVFIKPFSIETWITIAVYASLAIVGYVMIDLATQPKKTSSIIKRSFSMLERQSNLVFRSLVGRKIPSEPIGHSARIAFSTLILCGFFIITLYRAILVAFVTVNVDVPPVESFSDIKHSNYRVGVWRSTYYDDAFIHADKHTEEHKLEKMNKVVRFDGPYDSFINKMIAGMDGASNVLLYTDKSRIFNQIEKFKIFHER